MNKILLALMLLTLFACNSPSNHPSQIIKKPIKIDSIQQTVTKKTESFGTYCNVRYNYCINYPKGIVYPQPESYNGDGRVFKNKHGDDVLTVFGRINISVDGEPISLKQQFIEDLNGLDGKGSKDRIITHQKLENDFFVISGYKRGVIFHQKTIVKDGAFAYAILRYSENEKDIYDKVSENIFKSFK